MTKDIAIKSSPRGRRGARLGPRTIPLTDLVPHPLNANVMTDDSREKLKAHIKRTGRYPYLIVRPHPDQQNKFQVLDGHHRIAVLQELGHVEARYIQKLWIE